MPRSAATSASRAHQLWEVFKRWYAEEQNSMNTRRTDEFKTMDDAFERSASKAKNKSSKAKNARKRELENRKKQLERDLEDQLRAQALDKWQNMSQEAGLQLTDWYDITPEEIDVVASILGAAVAEDFTNSTQPQPTRASAPTAHETANNGTASDLSSQRPIQMTPQSKGMRAASRSDTPRGMPAPSSSRQLHVTKQDITPIHPQPQSGTSTSHQGPASSDSYPSHNSSPSASSTSNSASSLSASYTFIDPSTFSDDDATVDKTGSLLDSAQFLSALKQAGSDDTSSPDLSTADLSSFADLVNAVGAQDSRRNFSSASTKVSEPNSMHSSRSASSITSPAAAPVPLHNSRSGAGSHLERMPINAHADSYSGIMPSYNSDLSHESVTPSSLPESDEDNDDGAPGEPVDLQAKSQELYDLLGPPLDVDAPPPVDDDLVTDFDEEMHALELEARISIIEEFYRLAVAAEIKFVKGMSKLKRQKSKVPSDDCTGQLNGLRAQEHQMFAKCMDTLGDLRKRKIIERDAIIRHGRQRLLRAGRSPSLRGRQVHASPHEVWLPTSSPEEDEEAISSTLDSTLSSAALDSPVTTHHTALSNGNSVSPEELGRSLYALQTGVEAAAAHVGSLHASTASEARETERQAVPQISRTRQNAEIKRKEEEAAPRHTVSSSQKTAIKQMDATHNRARDVQSVVDDEARRKVEIEGDKRAAEAKQRHAENTRRRLEESEMRREEMQKREEAQRLEQEARTQEQLLREQVQRAERERDLHLRQQQEAEQKRVHEVRRIAVTQPAIWVPGEQADTSVVHSRSASEAFPTVVASRSAYASASRMPKVLSAPSSKVTSPNDVKKTLPVSQQRGPLPAMSAVAETSGLNAGARVSGMIRQPAAAVPQAQVSLPSPKYSTLSTTSASPPTIWLPNMSSVDEPSGRRPPASVAAHHPLAAPEPNHRAAPTGSASHRSSPSAPTSQSAGRSSASSSSAPKRAAMIEDVEDEEDVRRRNQDHLASNSQHLLEAKSTKSTPPSTSPPAVVVTPKSKSLPPQDAAAALAASKLRNELPEDAQKGLEALYRAKPSSTKDQPHKSASSSHSKKTPQSPPSLLPHTKLYSHRGSDKTDQVGGAQSPPTIGQHSKSTSSI